MDYNNYNDPYPVNGGKVDQIRYETEHGWDLYNPGYDAQSEFNRTHKPKRWGRYGLEDDDDSGWTHPTGNVW